MYHWLSTRSRRLLFTILVTVLALLASTGLHMITGGRVVVMPFFAAVIAAALYAGIGPAIGCALLAPSVLLVAWARTGAPPTAADYVTVVGFEVLAAVVIVIAARVRHVEARARFESNRAEEQKTALLTLERQARHEAERVGKMKDEFLATLSHELRTPLSAIVGWAQVLNTQPLPSQVGHGLEIIERNARAQTRIIDDLLDTSRIIAGKAKLDVRAVDLQKIVDSAIASVQPATQAKKIRVDKSFGSGVGAITGDPGRLQQVMWNLLSNAVKFTPEGGLVEVRARQANQHVEIAVSDTGIGIKPDFLPFVFDRFRQADASTTREHQGLGLGLSICKQLVEMHGGTLRVASEGEGKGATFTVALPLGSTPLVAEDSAGRDRRHAPAVDETSDAAPPSLAGLQVLVVEDQPDTCELITLHLRSTGAQVTLVHSGQEALAALDRQRFDVLISDIGMSHEDGNALIKKVRARSAEHGGAVPALALTAFVRSEDRRRAILSGYQMHLAKPADPLELLTLVAALAGRIHA